MNSVIRQIRTPDTAQVVASFLVLSILAVVYWDLWSDVHHLLRFMLIFALMIAVNYVGVCHYKKWCRDTGKILLLLGSVLYIICMWEVGSSYYVAIFQYHILIFLLCVVGILPVAIYLRSFYICILIFALLILFVLIEDIWYYMPFWLQLAAWIVHHNHNIKGLIFLLLNIPVIFAWLIIIFSTTADSAHDEVQLAIGAFSFAALLVCMYITDRNPDKWFSIHRIMAPKNVGLCTILPQVMIVAVVLIYSLLPLAFGDRLNVTAMPVHINDRTGGIILDYAITADKSCAECFNVDSFDVRKEISDGKELYLGMSGCNASVCSTQQLVDMPPQADYYIKGDWFLTGRGYSHGIVSFKHINKYTVPKDKLDSIIQYYLRDDAKAIVVSLKVLQGSGRAYISELTFPDEMCAIEGC